MPRDRVFWVKRLEGASNYREYHTIQVTILQWTVTGDLRENFEDSGDKIHHSLHVQKYLKSDLTVEQNERRYCDLQQRGFLLLQYKFLRMGRGPQES